MLKEWRLSQFKSVAGKECLRLGPLTVFTGANSSGKSSVVQSILLLAQTQTSKVTDRALVLNGELAKLGTFDDVLHDGAENRQIGLGFTLSVPLAYLNQSSLRVAQGFYYPGFYWAEHTPDTIAEFDVDLVFAPIHRRGSDREKAESLQAQLDRAVLTTRLHEHSSNPTHSDKHGSGLQITVSRRSDQDIQDLISENALQLQGAVTTEAFRYMVDSQVDLAARVAHFGGRNRIVGNSRVVASDLEHFLPVRLLVLYERIPREVVAHLDMLLEEGPQKFDGILAEWSKSADRVRVAITNAIRKSGGDDWQAALVKLRSLLRHRYSLTEEPTAKQIIQSAIEVLIAREPKTNGG